MGKFKQVFRQVAGPAGGQCAARLAGILCYRAGGGPCAERETLPDMAVVWPGQRSAVAAVSAAGAWDSEPRHLQSCVPSARIRRPSKLTSGASWRRLPRPTGSHLTGVVAVDGKALRGAFERGSAPPSRCTWSTSLRSRRRMVLAQQTAPGRNETNGRARGFGLLSLEGSIVTADALHCHRALPPSVLDRGGRLRAGDQGQPGHL